MQKHLKTIVGRGYMNIKKKLSVLLVLCVVMVGHAHQDMSVTQASVTVPQEQKTVTVPSYAKQPKKKAG